MDKSPQRTSTAALTVILFCASIAPMISMIKWQCPSCYYCYCYYYYVLLLLLSLFLIITIFMMCRFSDYAGFTWSSCHAGVVRFLLDGCYGRWFTSNSAQRHHHCVQAACALCCSVTSFADMNSCRHWVLINKIREISLMQWPEPVR